MYGYKISFKGLPVNKFACSTTVNSYDWCNRNDKNVLELSVSKAEKTTVILNDETISLKGEYFSCVAGDEAIKAFCDAGKEKEITSVAVQFEKLNVTASYLKREDVADNSVFLIPAIMEDNSEITEISRLLNKYIKCSISEMAYDRAKCISVWFEILYTIDKTVRIILSAQPGSNVNYYVKKLDYIIEKNYSGKISLGETARQFGVSESYLSWIYRNTTGRRFSDALLTRKMEKVKELVLTTSMPASEIAQETGFCDVIYLRKKFKKFFGVSMSEFRNINKGLTLYHDKPVR